MSTVILWRRLDLPGHEIASLDALDNDWKLAGTARLLDKLVVLTGAAEYGKPALQQVLEVE